MCLEFIEDRLDERNVHCAEQKIKTQDASLVQGLLRHYRNLIHSPLLPRKLTAGIHVDKNAPGMLSHTLPVIFWICWLSLQPPLLAMEHMHRWLNSIADLAIRAGNCALVMVKQHPLSVTYISHFRDFLLDYSVSFSEITLEFIYRFVFRLKYLNSFHHTPICDTAVLFQHFHVYADGSTSENLSFSFSSNSWLMIYELGAAKCLIENIKPEYIDQAHFLGTGTGSIIAALMACQADIDKFTLKILDLATKSAELLFGHVNIVKEVEKMLDESIENNMAVCEERLSITTHSFSLTSFPFLSLQTKNKFESKNVLFLIINAVESSEVYTCWCI